MNKVPPEHSGDTVPSSSRFVGFLPNSTQAIGEKRIIKKQKNSQHIRSRIWL